MIHFYSVVVWTFAHFNKGNAVSMLSIIFLLNDRNGDPRNDHCYTVMTENNGNARHDVGLRKHVVV